jgi:hypothetical protein
MIPLRAITTERVDRAFRAGRSPGSCGAGDITISAASDKAAVRMSDAALYQRHTATKTEGVVTRGGPVSDRWL